MREVLPIPPILVDPEHRELVFKEIAKQVGVRITCDGINDFDCFICYREGSDALLADHLFVYLKSVGIQPFLYKKCLPDGTSEWNSSIQYGKYISR